MVKVLKNMFGLPFVYVDFTRRFVYIKNLEIFFMTLTLNFNMKKTENLYKWSIKCSSKMRNQSRFLEILYEVTKSAKTFHIFVAHKLGWFSLFIYFWILCFCSLTQLILTDRKRKLRLQRLNRKVDKTEMLI